MKKITLGILAHVDAGKTTLTESLLLKSGIIKKAGRVDNKDAFLDTEKLEKERGVTILSKQAVIDMPKNSDLNMSDDDHRITIIDTPGHMDFVSETERAISVLDMAILVISGPDGVTDSTIRICGMLGVHKVPYMVFVNKMDMCQRSIQEITDELNKKLGSGHVHFTDINMTESEEVASISEELIEKFLEEGSIAKEDISELYYKRKLHPVLFGSALKSEGTEDILKFITAYSKDMIYQDDFAARVFKIVYENGHKLSFIKMYGGTLKVRDTIQDERLGDAKVNQIRLYSGGNYEALNEVTAGDVVTLVGLDETYIGMGLSEYPDDVNTLCQPILTYDIILPDDVPSRVFVPKLRELVSEDPLLRLNVSEKKDSINISVMGKLQLEILHDTILDRYGVDVGFSTGKLIYKETIAAPVIGYGHFEPLRHYAEVHLLMEPLPEGSGIEIGCDVSASELGINWIKTIYSCLSENLPKGVLTGSELTDMRITIIAGKAHLKHTESADFREAVRRAVRQGLMKTESVLLEPWYEYEITIPADAMGRVMNDLSRMGDASLESQDEETAVITGISKSEFIIGYREEIKSLTSGKGIVELKNQIYRPCEDQDEIVAGFDYDPDADVENPSFSVFCEHGAGRNIPWDECQERMHIDSREADYFDDDSISAEEELLKKAEIAKRTASAQSNRDRAIGTDEIDAILRNSTHANAGAEKRQTKRVYITRNTDSVKGISGGAGPNAASKTGAGTSAKIVSKPKYLLVDGYNIIHAWQDLKSILDDRRSDGTDMEGARYKLLDYMSEYRALKDTEIIVVFDAYRVRGHYTEKMDYRGVHVVYTKEAETADQYIARFTVENTKNLDITVATSDGLVQLITRGENCKLMSANDLEYDYRNKREEAIRGISS